ncbi:MAG: aspartate aminotransferase family protein, partial [Thermoplasmata archaeon]|nr:aspartate aminotransferase family protein [Thermoplasmata archaeon]
ALSAMRANLQKVYTEKAFRQMISLAERFEKGISKIIERYELPWHVTRLGIRIDYHFMPRAPRNGAEAEAARDPQLDKLLHLMLLNRGILITPFHSMSLISPYTIRKNVDFHTKIFEECVRGLI